jgi:hypothetical protein
MILGILVLMIFLLFWVVPGGVVCICFGCGWSLDVFSVVDLAVCGWFCLSWI